jgi:hypothetical protein
VATPDDTDVGSEEDDDAAVVVVFFTVFGIPHICDSVVLTTFRLGLPGSHISDLIFADTELIGERIRRDDDNCCPYTIFADKIAVNANIIAKATSSLDVVRLSINDSHSDPTWFISLKRIIVEENEKQSNDILLRKKVKYMDLKMRSINICNGSINGLAFP